MRSTVPLQQCGLLSVIDACGREILPPERVLNPLIDNAYENIPAEGGSIVVRTEATDDQLEIFIEDNGPGIPEKDAERVFERFVKLDSFKEGMGLGLTFSRTMARRMGGDVVLDTTYAGSGARFKVTLPI